MRFDRTGLRITAATSAALLATGCGSSAQRADQPTRVCADSSGRRTEDGNCNRATRAGGGSGAHFYYLGRGSRVPRIGERATGGSMNPSAGVAYAPARTVTRGGFGRSGWLHGFRGS